jgi:(S)-ureidoglycine aminohydrolase
VIISEEMGARLCQTIIKLTGEGELKGRTVAAQLFFYVIGGKCKVVVNDESKELSQGHFVYIPIGTTYHFNALEEGTQLLSFHKTYESLEGMAVPGLIFGNAGQVPAKEYLGDPALRLQVLLPEDLTFDMAVNIFTYDPGGHLPMVETHIMEHGLLYLQGQGIYMLDHEWYPVRKGDCIWMGPYCQQWFTAMGKEPAVYIYYKNVNRFPATI